MSKPSKIHIKMNSNYNSSTNYETGLKLEVGKSTISHATSIAHGQYLITEHAQERAGGYVIGAGIHICLWTKKKRIVL